jgi:hypothetical protein
MARHCTSSTTTVFVIVVILHRQRFRSLGIDDTLQMMDNIGLEVLQEDAIQVLRDLANEHRTTRFN